MKSKDATIKMLLKTSFKLFLNRFLRVATFWDTFGKRLDTFGKRLDTFDKRLSTFVSTLLVTRHLILPVGMDPPKVVLRLGQGGVLKDRVFGNAGTDQEEPSQGHETSSTG